LRIAQTHNPAARKNVVTATLMNRARMLNKVPEVTFDFWLIKLLAVTVGETAADYMSLDLDLGLATTSWILSGLLMVALALQFLQVRYVPWIYWVARGADKCRWHFGDGQSYRQFRRQPANDDAGLQRLAGSHRRSIGHAGSEANGWFEWPLRHQVIAGTKSACIGLWRRWCCSNCYLARA
jgi:hypothetical protein